MQSRAIDIVDLVSWTTIDAALCVVVAGLMSGFVALGFVQIYARERIQRRVLHSYFDYVTPDGQYPSAIVGASLAASLLQMPERVLCRLYYRQIAGQFLAAVNAEAAGGAKTETPGPVGAFLLHYRRPAKGKVPQGNGGIEDAVRQIDVLQADLGDAVLRAVMKTMIIAWWVIYANLGMLAGFQILRELTGTNQIADGSSGFIGYLAGVFLTALLGGAVLALGSAAAGLVAFIWLDRTTAAQ
jgi:hypothetical protein